MRRYRCVGIGAWVGRQEGDLVYLVYLVYLLLTTGSTHSTHSTLPTYSSLLTTHYGPHLEDAAVDGEQRGVERAAAFRRGA